MLLWDVGLVALMLALVVLLPVGLYSATALREGSCAAAFAREDARRLVARAFPFGMTSVHSSSSISIGLLMV